MRRVKARKTRVQLPPPPPLSSTQAPGDGLHCAGLLRAIATRWESPPRPHEMLAGSWNGECRLPSQKCQCPACDCRYLGQGNRRADSGPAPDCCRQTQAPGLSTRPPLPVDAVRWPPSVRLVWPGRAWPNWRNATVGRSGQSASAIIDSLPPQRSQQRWPRKSDARYKRGSCELFEPATRQVACLSSAQTKHCLGTSPDSGAAALISRQLLTTVGTRQPPPYQ